MKKLLAPFVIVLVVLVGFAFMKNTIAKSVLSAAVTTVTGLRTGIGSVSLGILNTRLGIKNFKMHNPGGFKDREMISIPEVYVDYNLSDILQGDNHIEEMRLNLEHLTVVKNEKGLINIEQIKTVKQSKAKKSASPEEKAKAKKEAAKTPGRPAMRIDVLHLRVGKVTYKDYSAGGEPVVQEFDVAVDERFENITDPAELVNLILMRTLTKTTIGRLANLDLGVFDTNSLAAKAGELGSTAVDAMKKAFQF